MPTLRDFALLLPPPVAPAPEPLESPLLPHAVRARAAVEATAAHFITRSKGVSFVHGGSAERGAGNYRRVQPRPDGLRRPGRTLSEPLRAVLGERLDRHAR